MLSKDWSESPGPGPDDSLPLYGRYQPGTGGRQPEAVPAARELEHVAPTYGARTGHQYWDARGFNSRISASCNTFTASASKVS